jgi:6-phosphogluconolactonase
MSKPTIQVVTDAATIAATAAELILSLAQEAIRLKGRFSIALSGGSTPKTLYEMLASDAYRNRIDWNAWDIYFSDERCVPPDNKDSNFKMAAEAMLDRVPINRQSVYRMKGEIDPKQAAADYAHLLQEKAGEGGLDLVLLGMGDDGHTASLFPGSAALRETRELCVANFVQKFGVWRITMSAAFINRSDQVIVLVSGAGKAARVAEVLDGPRDPVRLPIQLIDPNPGRLLWLMDAAAAGTTEEN